MEFYTNNLCNIYCVDVYDNSRINTSISLSMYKLFVFYKLSSGLRLVKYYCMNNLLVLEGK